MTDGGCDFGTNILNEELLEESEDISFYENMESKGWVEEECEYTVTCECELEPVLK